MIPAAHRLLRLAALISGSGTTLANLISRIRDRRLQNVRIVAVISSHPGARGNRIATEAGLPLVVIRRSEHRDLESFSDAIVCALDAHGVQLAVMGGFLHLWRIPDRYAGRVLNVHPALLPAFGGRGMYGLRVHQAVLASGQAESGCTVHLADNQYDHGPIIAQRRVPVLKGDGPEALAERVAAAERELYPEVIQAVAEKGFAYLERDAPGRRHA